jgi:hypothetical protein
VRLLKAFFFFFFSYHFSKSAHQSSFLEAHRNAFRTFTFDAANLLLILDLFFKNNNNVLYWSLMVMWSQQEDKGDHAITPNQLGVATPLSSTEGEYYFFKNKK